MRSGRLGALALLVRVPFRISRWRPLAAVAMQVSSGLAAVSFAWGLRMVVDGIGAAHRSELDPGVAVVVVSVLWAVGGSYVAFVLRHQMIERTTLVLDTDLGTAAGRIPGIEHFERHEYLDRLEFLRQQHQVLAMLPDSVAQLLAVVVRLAATLALLASIDWRLILLPVFSIPSVLGTLGAQKRMTSAFDTVSVEWRRQFALFQLGAEEPGGRELRVLGRRPLVARQFSTSLDTANAALTSALWRATGVQTLGWAVFGAAFAGGLLLVGHDALGHHVGAGDLVLAITLAAQMNSQVSVVGSVSGAIAQALQTAERFSWLLAQSTPTGATSAPAPDRLEHGIDLLGVRFAYPGAGPDVLSEVDLHLPAGATVALVGPNGAGKTTLVKLLTGMYRPSAGRILVDGRDLTELDPAGWRSRISAGFQDHARFEFSALRSVGVGLLERVDDEEAVGAALARAGASDVVGTLPEGLGTQLGRAFEDGVELSGGQWQKLALARAMMRDRPLLMTLDEPTAALDASTEAALFEAWATASRAGAAAVGSITLFVTHRLSTVKMADLIVVIDGGRVQEVGTHQRLMAAGGAYAHLYRLQAASYGSG